MCIPSGIIGGAVAPASGLSEFATIARITLSLKPFLARNVSPSTLVSNFVRLYCKKVLLAIIDILMRIVGLVALGFIVFGGIKYVTSQGSPEGTKDAQGTVINALIGVGIATIAVAVVSFLGSRIG